MRQARESDDAEWHTVVYKGKVWRDYRVSDQGDIEKRVEGTFAPWSVYYADGYARTSLSGHGQPRSARVHQLVLEAFVGPPGPGQEARHLDGDKANNRLSNLAWGTHTENMRDAIRHGTHVSVTRRRAASADLRRRAR